RKKQVTYTWEVTNPINSYTINVNIGDYVNWTETYPGDKGDLDCSYWVLRQNEQEAREHFKQATMTLEAFEHWFGPYPFYEDSYKLVHVPYLGMEHQSSVTYGNAFGNGYLGRDLSQSGEGLKFDFIIVHESGHEWFANSLTNKDVADMWIHESFTNYSESLYLEYHFGQASAYKYVRGTRSNIRNDIPIIGPYNVRREGSGDMYYKGGNMLHTIRRIINDDEAWRGILRGLNEDFYHQTVDTEMVESYIAEKSGEYLQPLFDIYLRDVRVPTFTYRQTENGTLYRWSNVPSNFIMPLDITVNGENQRIIPTYSWQMLEEVTWNDEIGVDSNYYIYQEDQTVK
ncbi:MAG: M1 family aminopeptidase, partial [Bacteroidota bacterium]